ncbi:uncharacterized protein LAJ45_04155 [Morchella importuna]|uniref:uncharacterized protein n=1 Tax=Morchella importuna TaxID=1174673 RepID=UPI001E8E7BB1|nr:uncharacterized protein LAJ45_04155 [Morchella importuna]KAH8151534.1 hypothetical protein LAJ45_04155 [Morchella importuna]
MKPVGVQTNLQNLKTSDSALASLEIVHTLSRSRKHEALFKTQPHPSHHLESVISSIITYSHTSKHQNALNNP